MAVMYSQDLASVTGLQSLTALSLNWDFRRRWKYKPVDFCSEHRAGLSSLCLRSQIPKIREFALQIIAALATLTGLQVLSFRPCTLASLSVLSVCHSLQALHLEDTLELPICAQLTHLALDTQVHSVFAGGLTGLSYLSELKELHWQFSSLPSHVTTFATFPAGLTCLSLKGRWTHMDCVGMKSAMKHLLSLRALDMNIYGLVQAADMLHNAAAVTVAEYAVPLDACNIIVRPIWNLPVQSMLWKCSIDSWRSCPFGDDR